MSLMVGDRVEYTADYLKSINAQAYAELYEMRGTVTERGKTLGRKLTLVRVRWDGDDRDRNADIDVLQKLEQEA